jgi:hypothetical protein
MLSQLRPHISRLSAVVLCGPLLAAWTHGKAPPSLTSIGSNSGTGVNTVSITVPAAGVPAGSLLLVAASDSSNTAGSVATIRGNVFGVSISQQAPANVATAAVTYSSSGNRLFSGDVITYTLGQAGHNATLAAYYVAAANISLGNNVVDAGSINGLAGTSTAPSVTSSPGLSGELFFAIVASASAIASFTQDSTDAAWASPPGQVSIAAPTLVGGSAVNRNASPLTYAPTLGTSVPWANLIFGIIPR